MSLSSDSNQFHKRGSDFKELYLEVSKELDVPYREVERSVKGLFDRLSELLRSPEHPSILIHKLGTFHLNPPAVRHMMRKKSTITEEEIENWESLLEALKDLKYERK